MPYCNESVNVYSVTVSMCTLSNPIYNQQMVRKLGSEINYIILQAIYMDCMMLLFIQIWFFKNKYIYES